MTGYYTLVNTIKFRVPTVDDVLELREKFENNGYGNLIAFNYTTKYIKVKGEIVEEYQVGSAKIEFTSEKEPEERVYVHFSFSEKE